jgi:TonB-linked SusC/RagA family outer membrane protein
MACEKVPVLVDAFELFRRNPSKEAVLTPRSILRVLLFAAVAIVGSVDFAAAQTGSVTGTVTNRQTNQPIVGAQVQLASTRMGAVTDQTGRYTIANVPAGTYNVIVQFLGFAEGRIPNVAVRPGAAAVANFQLQETVLSLQEVVVTGVTDPTAGIKLPFTVARVGAEQLQVPTTNSAIASIQGKVAGATIVRGSGKPGDGVNIMLRSPTAIENSNTPLIIVDGVIVARAEGNICATCDIEALDVESVEVIKGAAAASLYGSRAAAGVISITTKRGKGGEMNQTRVTSRSEFGREAIGREIGLSQSHQYRLTADGRSFADANGNPVTYQNRTTPTVAIPDKPYPGQLYDNLHAVFQPNQFLSTSFSVNHNTENTTFLVSGSRFDQNGALVNNEGYWRNTGRVSIDHRIGDRFSLALVGTHTRSWEDGTSGNPYSEALLYPPVVDLTRKDASGNYLQIPDSSVLRENPLWRQASRDNYEDRTRTSASVNARYSPLRWITVDAQYSYDHNENKDQVYVAKGTPTSVTADVPSDGQLELAFRQTQAQNGSFAVTALRQFQDFNTRFTARGLFEKETSERIYVRGDDFLVPDVRDITAAGTLHNDTGSSTTDVRANGYLGNLGIDFKDKYITDVLLRRDGSSLFGEDERWHTYYRGSVAWRLTQEPWFRIPNLDELKLRYAIGTAGGRPSFGDSRARWSVSRAGGLTRSGGTAGNSGLRPHFTREQEVGIDMIGLNNRVSLELVYAHQVSRDNVIVVPVPVITGYSSVNANAGEVVGRTYEATLQARVINGRNFTLQVGAVLDNTRNKITRWERSCFQGSNADRDHELTCVGAQLGDFYLQSFMHSADQLPWWLRSRANEFQVNDEGYLVWVGPGNNYTEGVAKNLWNTLTFTANGNTYRFGEPILKRDSLNQVVFDHYGASLPDVQYGVPVTVRYKNLSGYALVRGTIGGKVYNAAKQELYEAGMHEDVDQAGKPEENKKALQYYTRALANGGCCGYSEPFLEDGTHAKLAELFVRYRFTRNQLQRFLGGAAPSEMSLGINGRNLFILTGYTGFDPDAGSPLSRVENFRYPHMRSITMTLDITF